MTWLATTLGEVCEIVGGATPKTSVPDYWGGGIPWVTPKDLSDLDGQHEIAATPRTLSDKGLKSCAATVLPAGSVLLSSRAPIGHVAINAVPMATNQGFKSLVTNPGTVDAKFLFWWLRGHRPMLEAMGTGATFKEISKKTTASIPIDLPPIVEQRRIAAILDAADALRAKRRQALAKLDTLTQAIFIDMFGSPLNTHSTLRRAPLKSLGKVNTGRTPPGTKDGMYGDAVPFLTPGDLETSEPPLRWLSDEGAAHVRLAEPGSTLVCCIGATIGKVGETTRVSSFNQQINAVQWDRSQISPAYGTETMRFLRREVARLGASTTLPILKKSEFERIEIAVPPLKDQRVFEEHRHQVHTRFEEHRASSAQLEVLFSSLQQRAFRGEL